MTGQTVSQPALNPEILKSIDIFLEDFYERSTAAGQKMAEVGLSTAQIRNLETLVASTTRFSEIINHIKNQAGKERKEKKWSQVAPMLIEQLAALQEQAHQFGSTEPTVILKIKLRLAKGWARQVVANYLYRP